MSVRFPVCFFFFLNDPATTEISPLPLPDALPIFGIVKSISRPARAALTIKPLFERVGLRLLKERNLTTPPNLPLSISRSTSVEMPPPTPRHPKIGRAHV